MGCVQSVSDKGAAGTWSAGAQDAARAADAQAAVAELLGGAAMSAPVEISVKCRNLPDRDVLSKSDPMAVLLAGDARGSSWGEVSRSDVVANSLSPAFNKPLRATYTFERLQATEASFLLSDLLTAPGQRLVLPLLDRGRRSLPGAVVELAAEELPNTNSVVTLSLAALKLDNKDTFGKSDPFLRISKAREGGDWAPVLKTEVVNNNLNPEWRPFRASMAQLCNCDVHRPLLVEVFDHDAAGGHDLIGQAQTSLQGLQDAAATGQGLPLARPAKAGGPAGGTAGTLKVRGVQVVPRPSFLDYIRGGVQVNFAVAVDFTASNRDPRDPASLHYLGTPTTIYEDAISAVGCVLEKYDTDRQFPAFGFGAQLPPAGTVSHCFALNGSASSPEVAGLQGLLQAYRQTLNSVRLSGPTLFAPLINTVAQIAAQPSHRLQYFVLLILTDGAIMDMGNTLRALVAASQLPLSILIVGVGNEDFAAMEVLDGDRQRIRSPEGQAAARDTVQFVPFRPHERHTVEGLAAKLLAELPGQVVEYWNDMKRIPPPPSTGAAQGVPPAAVGAVPAAVAAVPPPAVPAGAEVAPGYPKI